MINNLEHITNILKFESEDDFYFLQILKRRKDNPNMKGDSVAIASYYIESSEQLIKLFPEVKLLCDFHNARACINLNKRSFEDTCLKTLQKVTEQIIKKSYKHTKKAFDSVCGETSAARDSKIWILDFDTKDLSFITSLKEQLEKVSPVGEKVKEIIPTKNGYHVLTSVFDVMAFNSFFGNWAVIEKPEIKKNNPTILYIP